MKRVVVLFVALAFLGCSRSSTKPVKTPRSTGKANSHAHATHALHSGQEIIAAFNRFNALPATNVLAFARGCARLYEDLGYTNITTIAAADPRVPDVLRQQAPVEIRASYDDMFAPPLMYIYLVRKDASNMCYVNYAPWSDEDCWWYGDIAPTSGWLQVCYKIGTNYHCGQSIEWDLRQR